MKRTNLAFGLAAGLFLASPWPAEAGGLFDDFARAFFGRPSQSIAGNGPLKMTVKKHRSKKVPVAETVKLDPAIEPDWYLRDPTLRRGDIVVTKSGVLVYNGRDSDMLRRSDFASLGGRTAGKSWRNQLEIAAKGGRSYFENHSTTTPASAQQSNAEAR